MLTLTDNASSVVKSITAENAQEDDAGLRISHQGDDAGSLGVTVSEAPQPGDQIVEREGARVFLEESAAVTLDDKVLDAQVDPNGAVQFSIGVQE